MFVVTSLHHGCSSYSLSIPCKFLVVDKEEEDQYRDNLKIMSPLKCHSKYYIQWCFMALRSIVDSSFQEWRTPISLFKYSIMLTWSLGDGCNEGCDKRNCIGLFNMVLGLECIEPFSFNLVKIVHWCFLSIKWSDSPFDLLDNSMIESKFSTFIDQWILLLDITRKTSQGRLGETVRAM